MSNSIGKAGYTQVSSTHTTHLLGNAPSTTIRWSTNVTDDAQRLLIQTRL